MTKKKLLDRARDTLRRKNYAYRTEQAYLSWIKRYILFHNKRHPSEMGAVEIESFLTHLAVEREVSPSTQNQALSALSFLYQEVLRQELDQDILPVPAKRIKQLPIVLSRRETRAVLSELHGIHKLITQLLYGSGLRVTECLSLRIKDLDFDRKEITVRCGKGAKDRKTVLPESISLNLKIHLKQTKMIHQQDLVDGYGSVYLPRGLSRKYPNASREWIWQYLFPAQVVSGDIISIQVDCAVQCDQPPKELVSRNTLLLIFSATASPPICWKMVMISGLSRSFWVTSMYPPPWSTPTCSTKGEKE